MQRKNSMLNEQLTNIIKIKDDFSSLSSYIIFAIFMVAWSILWYSFNPLFAANLLFLVSTSFKKKCQIQITVSYTLWTDLGGYRDIHFS